MRKFIGPQNPLLSARIAYFVFFAPERKNMVAKFKGHARLTPLHLIVGKIPPAVLTLSEPPLLSMY